MKKLIVTLLIAFIGCTSSHALSYLGTSSGNDNNKTEIENIINTALGGSVSITLLGKSDGPTNPSGFSVFNIDTPLVIGDLTLLHGDGAKNETFDISYNGTANVSFITIKFGNDYEVFAYMDDQFLVKYKNGISHVSVWTTQVPDSGTTLLLLSAGILGLIGFKRFRR